MTDTHLSEIRFRDFSLPEVLLQNLDKAGFEFCTPIQAQTLPIALKAQDLAGQAQTGTGKTLAFLVVVLSHLLQNPAPAERKVERIRAIIIAPTRELAIQIHHDCAELTAGTELTLGLVYGGTAYEKQRKQLAEGVDILIGTPGRIIDYNKQSVFDLRGVEAMVLDEADRMFDLGFISDIRFLLRRMPAPTKRLNLLFSATLSYRVMELSYEHMNNPQTVKVEAEQVTADRVTQALYYPSEDEKIALLIGLINKLQPTRSMIFTNTKRTAELVDRFLRGNDIPSGLLSGDVPQRKRQRLLQEFAEGQFNHLIATDIAARGLHIPEVSHVFNFDLPNSGEDYVHRIGRTARAGSEGDAISFACEESAFYLPEIEDYIGQKIPMANLEAELLSELKPPAKRDASTQPPRQKNAAPKKRRHRRGPKPGNSANGNAKQSTD